MAYQDPMTKLINKIERRLGTKMFHLPEELCKDKWATEVITQDTIDTYSRYLPRSIDIPISDCKQDNEGWYHIDEGKLGGQEIIGVTDLDWSTFSADFACYPDGVGYVDMYNTTSLLGVEDIALYQMNANLNSLFNLGIYVDYKAPNMFKLTNTVNNNIRGLGNVKIKVLLKHLPNLITIPSTQMELFEELATIDVAHWLYTTLKYYDGKEAIDTNIDLKLDELQSIGDNSNRKEIIDQLKEANVSASNQNCPIMLTIN